MKRMLVMVMLLCVMTGCATFPTQTEYKPYDKPYVAIYCPERQASTEIAVKDGDVYCAYLTMVNGKEVYQIDVYKNKRWQHVETVTTSVYEHPLFCESIMHDPIKETVGDYSLYTDDVYRIFLGRPDSTVHYELFGGGEGLRRVATDHRNTIAVLTSEMAVIDDVAMAKLYIYTLE